MILVHVFLPALVAALVRISGTACICRAPFRNEYGKTCLDCLFALDAFAFAAPAVSAFPVVAVGVVVQGVGGVFLGVADFVADSVRRVLVPRGVAHEHQVVGILANHFDDLVGVVLDIAPRNLLRFVVDFENHVVVLAIGFGHFFKEILGGIGLLVGFVGMPVDNHVNVVLDGRFDNGLDKLLLVFGVAGVALELDSVPFALPVFVAGSHGGAHDLDFHVVHHGRNSFFAPEFHCLGHQAPVKAHATHLNFGTVLYTLATAVNAALTLRVLAGHELAILANGANAGGGNVLGGGKRCTQRQRCQKCGYG